ncbi:NAD-dependent protein deacetylase sirtuin [Acrasis kona]|uniref:Regulatory protein SIR2 homolog 7 n=1 Tax=Acrasis kona TaxID=1008807 RepID=A0AAW2ZC91_9EUKA
MEEATRKVPYRPNDGILINTISDVQDVELLVNKIVNIMRTSKYTVLVTSDLQDPPKIDEELPKIKRNKRIPWRTPNKNYMAIAKLHEMGFIHHVITESTNNLHHASGIPSDSITELYGNKFIEVCKACKMEYKREYVCRNNMNLHKHDTGKLCDECRGPLYDNIIKFNEEVPNTNKAINIIQQAEVIITLGVLERFKSTMKVLSSNVKRCICRVTETSCKECVLPNTVRLCPSTFLHFITNQLQLKVDDFIFRHTISINTTFSTSIRKNTTSRSVVIQNLHPFMSFVDCIAYQDQEIKDNKTTGCINVDNVRFGGINSFVTALMFRFHLMFSEEVVVELRLDLNTIQPGTSYDYNLLCKPK